ncbi:MAG TPA: hypothetical protein VJ925_01820 [Longimicrobiales bacterium]|nr:hypothetical protein [Longimicrobiales bacterium]
MTGGQSDWHAFRCPVCGHRDEVELPELSGVTIDCPHCDTTLNVEAGTAEQIDATARVADTTDADSTDREPRTRDES